MHDDVVQFAFSQMLAGESAKAIEDELIAQGFNPPEVQIAVRAALNLKSQHYKKQGERRFLYGCLAALLGLVLTVASQGAASSGGRYMVFVGLLALGGVYALVGLVQSMTGWRIN